ncbi:MAG: DnaA/Hda family protein [Alphaproteobacteria bacterium]
MRARQLPLDLGHRPALGREDFLVAPGNAEAVAWLDRWPDWPAGRLCLHGPSGCGKSHLVQAFTARSGAEVVAAGSLSHDDPPRLARAAAIVVEDADQGVDETALMHLYNLVAEQGRTLLLTGRQPPGRWDVVLPDLRSRLATVTAVAITAPDDAVMAAVMVKLFADRQLAVGPEVVAYLTARMERSFAAARTVVATIDALALARRRPVTVPLVAEALRKLLPNTP